MQHQQTTAPKLQTPIPVGARRAVPNSGTPNPEPKTMTPKHFALIGAAGYVALRHMKAIRDTANRLVAALDISDSVGVIDSYFPEAHFFTEFERFDRHIDKLRRTPDGQAVNFVSICSPNYLHDAHMRFALRSNADAICEKPLVLNPWNIDGLQAYRSITVNGAEIEFPGGFTDLHPRS